MNAGSISNPNTAAGRVYAYMLERAGEWCDPYEMTAFCRTTAISTRISEVRHQLPAGHALDVRRVGQQHYYRIRRTA